MNPNCVQHYIKALTNHSVTLDIYMNILSKPRDHWRYPMVSTELCFRLSKPGACYFNHFCCNQKKEVYMNHSVLVRESTT